MHYVPFYIQQHSITSSITWHAWLHAITSSTIPLHDLLHDLSQDSLHAITSSTIPLHVQLHVPLHANYMLNYMLHYILNCIPLYAWHGIKFPEPMIACFQPAFHTQGAPLLKRRWCSRSSLSAATIDVGLAWEDPPQPPWTWIHRARVSKDNQSSTSQSLVDKPVEISIT